jgi:3-oxoacyl-[acyl-carrier-protein] synthase III
MMKILGTGIALPKEKETLEDMAKAISKSEHWIKRRFGIETRYVAKQETSMYLGAKAAKAALEKAGLNLEDIGWIIAACGTSDQAIPYNAAILQRELGESAQGIPSMDVGMTCLGSLAAMNVANEFFKAGQKKPILIVSSDIASVGVSPDRIEEYCLFGDGAGAIVVGTSEQEAYFHFETFGEYADICQLKAGGSSFHPQKGAEPKDFLFEMQGPALFKIVAQKLPEVLDVFWQKSNLNPSDINLVIPHQASAKGLNKLPKFFKIPKEKIVDIFSDYGNQVSASIPTTLHYALENRLIKPGDNVLLAGTSAGVSFGLGVIRF